MRTAELVELLRRAAIVLEKHPDLRRAVVEVIRRFGTEEEHCGQL